MYMAEGPFLPASIGGDFETLTISRTYIYVTEGWVYMYMCVYTYRVNDITARGHRKFPTNVWSPDVELLPSDVFMICENFFFFFYIFFFFSSFYLLVRRTIIILQDYYYVNVPEFHGNFLIYHVNQ